MIPIDSSLTSILHQSIQTVCSTGFSRLDTIPPKGGTTNITFSLMQNPITLRVANKLTLRVAIKVSAFSRKATVLQGW